MPCLEVKDHLLSLIEDYRDFNWSPINVQPVPSSTDFCKQVSKGSPCLYRAYAKATDEAGKVHPWTDPSLLECPAFTWTKQDLVGLVRDEVDVAVTPNGKADDLHLVEGKGELVFLSPATVQMTIEELLDMLEKKILDAGHEGFSPVYYLQSQNSNLTTTALAPILKHVPENFSFAGSVLGSPEAVNIWIGDERSITSTHRDPYENLYLVLKGCKTFTLYPPVDEVTLPTRRVLTGSYEFDPTSDTFSTIIDDSPDAGRIPWVSVDPLRPREELVREHPLYAYATPRIVTVHEGEILYLPSGWYHHVQQRCGKWDEDDTRAPCIAVNYWYDMEYEGEKYVMRQLVSRLVSALEKQDSPTDEQ